jgi:lysozyme family protein
MKFDRAVKIILNHEGGYVFNSEDPGGETKFGISKRVYPDLDIKNLTVETATQLYKRDYWDKIKAEELPEKLRLIMFDCAVNQGVKKAIKILQGSLGVPQDGILGPVTFLSLQEHPVGAVFQDVAKARLHHYAELPHWKSFGKGWAKRLLETVLENIEII